jgi:YVTN family beta-propeller protein
MAMGSSVRGAKIATVLLLSLAACGGGGETPTPQENSPAAEGPVELTLGEELEAELDIPDQPEWITTGFDSVWVTRDEAAAVERIDAETNEVVATIDVGAHPCAGIVAAYDSVWVPSCEEQALYRIDPETERAAAVMEIPVYLSTGALTTELSASAGSIWMVTKGKSGVFDALARIDPGTEEISTTIPLGYPGSSVAATEDAVWVTAPDDGVLLRVDPASDEVVAEVVGLEAPNFVAAGPEGVWVLSGTDSEREPGDGTVTGIDPETNEIAATVQLDENPGQASDIAVGEGFVYARSQYTLLAKIDPASGEVVERYTDRKGLGGVVVDFGSVWLSDFAFNNVWRVPV